MLQPMSPNLGACCSTRRSGRSNAQATSDSREGGRKFGICRLAQMFRGVNNVTGTESSPMPGTSVSTTGYRCHLLFTGVVTDLI